MRILGTEIGLSATDLANHVGCQHLTRLNRQAVCGEISHPAWRDPLLETLRARGLELETTYIHFLQTQGLSVFDATAADQPAGVETTIAAMRSGHDVIVQPFLEDGRWVGRADILRRVQRPSKLGSHSYEVVDTKLARETRGGTILQLVRYSEMVARLQGNQPELMHVVSPGNDFTVESFRVTDFVAYVRFVKADLERAVEANERQTYPEPVPRCETCRWWRVCDQRRRADDHLSLVAGISRGQRQELEEWGVDTLSALAALPLPIQQRPRRGARASYERAREQARVQLEARVSGGPVFELLSRTADRGLALLPEPSSGDMFFDIEGDPFALDGGLEYLLGWATLESDRPAYHKVWSVQRSDEREAFERFVDTVLTRRRQWPTMHVYHFAPYEPSALKRLMGRFGSRQDEVDELLRVGTFVDLHKVVKQAVRASVE
ncbi:MAG: TM0106 family RecB-like putative nuclease, partial [Polyangiaceae bacterium]|nr:TM0106 family RecB-like putative nuclease [Polyangiaceae bacterium]